MHVDVEMIVNQMIPASLQLKLLRNPEMEEEHAKARERLVDSSLKTMTKFYCSDVQEDSVEEEVDEQDGDKNKDQIEIDRFKEVFNRRNFERMEKRPLLIMRTD